ncbi:actin-like ATPase domain-containing protein [Backusella circina FSU 941]|nr:actin-like ATPase domain-containing protein [Backusella circina FSU 941]
MALLTTGLTTGLIIDCANLETSVLPVKLLYDHGKFVPPSNLHLSLAPHNPIPNNLLTPEVLEDIKSRVLFCSPLMIGRDQQPLEEAYKNFSSATDLYYPITLSDGTRANLLIPGWIRERTVEVLFEGDEEDEPSIAQCILDSLLKVQPDLRKPLISSMLVIGGTSLLPGFQSRLKQELLHIMRDPAEYEKRRYASLLRLQKSIHFIDNAEEHGAGRVFMNNMRGWIGGSLVGCLKISGEEITKEKFTGSVTDWSVGNWNNSSETSLEREIASATTGNISSNVK